MLQETYGLAVWLDERKLKVADKLRRAIDEALVQSRFGVVVLSPASAQSPWVSREIDSMVERDNRGQMRIVPVYHELTVEEAHQTWPLLSGHVGSSSEFGVERVAEEIAEAVAADSESSGNDVRAPFSVPGELLPFLVDREEQDFTVEQAIATRPNTSRRPTVCVVHGDEADCADMYLERLAKHSLGLIAPGFCNAPIKKYPVIWPERLPDLAELPAWLSRELQIELNRGRAGHSTRNQAPNPGASSDPAAPTPIRVGIGNSTDWNRRVRTRTSGGVGDRGSNPAPTRFA